MMENMVIVAVLIIMDVDKRELQEVADSAASISYNGLQGI